MTKYVFCDLDYTLLDNNKNISEANYKAIKEFESKGNKFIICSGRVPFALKQYKDFLHSTDIISSNGALIIANNNLIKNQLLSEEELIPITKYAIDNHINVRYFTSDYMIIINQEYAPKKAFMYNGYKEIDNNSIFDALKNEKIIKMVFSSDDKSILDKAETDIKNMNLKIECTFSLDIFLEINALNQNKGEGVIDYCKRNNVDIKDTISIGDNDNDISMLKVTGYSACPSNSIDKVKNIVDYVCKNDNEHDAIKEVLELFYE